MRKALVVIVWRTKPGLDPAKVLLLQLIEKRGGYWQPVTGGVDSGESFLEGALREAEEETGLKFDRTPQYLGLETRFPSRHGGEAVERAFYLPIFGGRKPPKPTLDGKEHSFFEWLSPQEACSRVKWPTNAEAIRRATSGQPPLLLTKRGVFLQDGEEITHEKTAALFHKSLRREKDGGFVVSCEGESLDVILEDTPRYVRSYDREKGQLVLTDGTREKLNPESLRVREDNSLVCVLENGWEATFLSAAYYEIAKDIVENGDLHALLFLGKRIPLSG